jgi:hypothetical protein
MRFARVALGGCAALLAFAAPAPAAVIVRAVPSAASVAAGDTLTVELRAAADQALFGFGLDLLFDGGVLSVSAGPVIAAPWDALDAPDGDGLAGVVFPDGISGPDLLLATVTFSALTPGATTILPGVSAGDLTEGFPLDPSGFASDVSFVGAQVQVVPEPSSAALFGLTLAALSLARGRGRKIRRAPRS